MNFRHIIKITLIVLACAAFAGGVMLVSQRLMTERDASPFEKRTQELEERDIATLTRPSAPAHEVYAALVRQGRRGLKEARSAALARKADPNASVRAGAAESLGFFGDREALGAVQALLEDPVPSVRVRALEGVGNRPDSARTPILLKYLERKELDAEEKVSAWSSLIRLAPNEGNRQEYGRRLMEIARSGDGAAETRAAFRLISFLPKDEELLELLRTKIRRDANSRLIPVAIRHLAAVGEAWIAKESAKLARHRDSRVRLAVAQTLHRSCPRDRDEVLDRLLMKEKNAHVFRAALRQLAYAEEKRASEVVARIRKARANESEIMNEIHEAESRPAKKEPDPCKKT